MKHPEETVINNQMSLPHPTALDLRGRQSVRATFKISPRAIEALSIVAAQLGIKQKSIFDHLIEDAQSLKLMAQSIDDESLKGLERIQKTFVISRNTLVSLEKAVKKTSASRDALVEMAIQRLLPIISREQQKHDTRKKMLNEINHFLDKGMELMAKFEADLGNDDPATVDFKNAIKALASAQKHIGAFVSRGKIIENFNW